MSTNETVLREWFFVGRKYQEENYCVERNWYNEHNHLKIERQYIPENTARILFSLHRLEDENLTRQEILKLYWNNLIKKDEQ